MTSSSLPSWPMFGYTSTHDSLQPRETVLSPTTVKGLKLAWSANGLTDPVVLPEPSGPSGARAETVFTTTSTTLLASRGTTGHRLWHIPFPPGALISPTSALAASESANLLFAGFSGSSATAVEAVRASDGRRVWSAPWPSTAAASCAPPRASIEGPLTLSGTTLYGQTSGGCVFALDALSGAVRWVTNGAGVPVAGQTSPAVTPPGTTPSEVLVGTYSGALVALTASTGTVMFSVPGCGSGESSPALSGGIVYAVGGRGLCAVDARSGTLLWAKPCGVAPASSPAVAYGHVFLVGGSGLFAGRLCSISASTGALSWSRAVGSAQGPPAAADGVLYVTAGRPGELLALDAATGAVLYCHLVAPGVFTAPVVAKGWIYLGGAAFSLSARASASAWIVQQRGTAAGELLGVAAVSRTDAWAVGAGAAALDRTLVEHWDGSAWTAVSSPSPNSVYDVLSGVVATSATNAWAVGGEGVISGSTASTLVEHWNGAAWTVVSSPSPSRAGNDLSGVAAVSPNDVWAVGSDDVTSASGPARTLALHWNGTSWAQVATPNPGTYNFLDAVARTPHSAQLWAVGAQTSASRITPLIERFTGARWVVVPAPALSGGELEGVTALGPNDAWAVGRLGSVPLVLHWDGLRWSRSPLPSIAGGLRGVVDLSAKSAWAVGGGLLLQWNGSSWSRAPWPRPSHGQLEAAATSAGASGWIAWAVGAFGSAPHPLVIARC